MAELPDDIARIDALTRNARNTWFVLLGALVFVGITLLQVEHIDFYGVDRATKLPLVDVEVPTRAFFVAAPILTAAIYGYFHLYLIRLWDALSVAGATRKGRPLGDVITPWLVTDAALHLRARLRPQDKCTTPRTMDGPAMLLNFALAWVFGIVVLGALWWQSMPARTLWMTLIAGLAFAISAFLAAASFAMMIQRMRKRNNGAEVNIWSSFPAMAGVLVIFPSVLILSHQRILGPLHMLAPIEIINQDIVERPTGWLPHDIARAEFRAHWCKREGVDPCKKDIDDREDFSEEWTRRRDLALRDLRRPDWARESETNAEGDPLNVVNLSGANLRQTFLAGAFLRDAQLQGTDLREAQMEGANLIEAQMQGAFLIGAQMQGANLIEAQMEDAILSRAQMQGAFLIRAQMQGANLIWAQMQGAILSRAQMQGANLIGAQMQGANLIGAQMQGADLARAQMQGADLARAQMQGADLARAQMQGADFSYSHLIGLTDHLNSLENTSLRAATNNAGALRFVDLSQILWDHHTDFRNAFLDASVVRSRAFEAKMGNPCQWIDRQLDEEEFYSHWRWWVEKESRSRWRIIAPPEWRDVPLPSPEQLAVDGLTNCEWKTDPFPTGK